MARGSRALGWQQMLFGEFSASHPTGCAAIDLGPAGDARTDHQADLDVLGLVAREQRARPDQRRVADQDVEQLRKLVQPAAAHEAADRRQPLVVAELAAVFAERGAQGADTRRCCQKNTGMPTHAGGGLSARSADALPEPRAFAPGEVSSKVGNPVAAAVDHA
jgi:hypothetical protein